MRAHISIPAYIHEYSRIFTHICALFAPFCICRNRMAIPSWNPFGPQLCPNKSSFTFSNILFMLLPKSTHRLSLSPSVSYTKSCLQYLTKLSNICWPFVGFAFRMIESEKNLAQRWTRGSVMEVKFEISSEFCSPNLIYNESVLRPWDCEVHGDLEKLWFWMHYLQSSKVVR